MTTTIKENFRNVPDSNNTAAEMNERVRKAVNKATEVYDDNPDTARLWLNTRLPAFHGRTPLEMLDSEDGLAEVINLLNCIDHGVYQ